MSTLRATRVLAKAREGMTANEVTVLSVTLTANGGSVWRGFVDTDEEMFPCVVNAPASLLPKSPKFVCVVWGEGKIVDGQCFLTLSSDRKFFDLVSEEVSREQMDPADNPAND